MRIVITQAQAGDARKYQPMLDYLRGHGIPARFTTSPDYQVAAEMFASGTVDAMFAGSGIAGTMMIKGLAEPLVRPVASDGSSTYRAVIIARKGSPRFTGQASYFDGKKVIFSALASAGEFYFHSLGPANPLALMKAASHGAAIDALNRDQADVAIVKNHVWNKEKEKYPALEKIGEDVGENPDNTLIVSRKVDAASSGKLADLLLRLQDDHSSEAMAVKNSLGIKSFIRTNTADFKHTLELLKKAGVSKSFAFKY